MFFNKKSKQDKGIHTVQGFESVYNLYAEQMFQIAYNKLSNREEAKEIVQNIFKSLWERKDSLQLQSSIKHYLFRATKLEVIDYYRQKIRDEEHLSCALEVFCAAEDSTQQYLNFNELSSQLDYLVDQMPCKCRKVYKLSREQGLSNREIASSLLISEKTVEAHMTKALKFLKDQLSEYQV